MIDRSLRILETLNRAAAILRAEEEPDEGHAEESCQCEACREARERGGPESAPRSIDRAAGGNPNHDPATGQFTGPGGQAGPGARKPRKRGRKRRLRERLRRKWRGELGEWKKQWRGYRKSVAREGRREWHSLRKEQKQEWASFRKGARREREQLRERHAKERRQEIEARKEEIRDQMKEDSRESKKAGYGRDEIDQDKAKAREEGKAILREELADLKSAHAGERRKLRDTHRERRDLLRESHAEERARHREDRKKSRRMVEEDIAREKEVFRRELREDIAKHGLRQKTRGPAARSIDRTGQGNPNHDAEGHFTGPGGAQASGAGRGKHTARQKRRRKRQRLRNKHQRQRERIKARHERERHELAREHRLGRRAADRRHAARLEGHAKTAPARHARVDREQAAKARRIDRGEARAKSLEERHAKERREFEKTATKDHGYLHKANEKLYESQRLALKAREGTPEEHEALEAKIATHREQFADPSSGLRKAMEDRHAKARQKAEAFLAKSATLRERLARQTEARHRKIDRTPERLEGRHSREKAELEREHAEAREDQAWRHSREKKRLGRHQRREMERHGFKARRKSKGGDGVPVAGPTPRRSMEGTGDGGIRCDARGATELAGVDQPPVDLGRPSISPGSRAIHHDRRDGAPSGEPGGRGLLTHVRAAAHGRFSPGRTHKASSAESILRHCLRTAGIRFGEWKRDELTDAERLDLLDAIREYSRAWLRHEAEGLFRWHGRKDAPEGDHRASVVAIDAAQSGNGGGARHLAATDSADPTADHRAGSAGRGDAGSACGSAVLLEANAQAEGVSDAGGPVARAEESRSAGGGGQCGAVGERFRDGPGLDDGPGQWGWDLDGPMFDTTRALSAPLRHAVGRFFDRVRGFLREAILAGAMALSGPEPLTGDDLAEVDRQHAAQAQFLDRFRDDVAIRTPSGIADPSAAAIENAMTAAQFVARAEMYGGGVFTATMALNRKKVIDGKMAVRERRFHRNPSPDVHACNTCLNESNKGWSAPGSLLAIGDAECLSMCDCYFVYELADGSTFITWRGWRRAA